MTGGQLPPWPLEGEGNPCYAFGRARPVLEDTA